jgi:4-amino-4-deoxy-L-arabinose transferase-like glycosyltransferase
MFGIIALVYILGAPIFIYRSAKQNGYNAWLWTLGAYGVGIGLQIVVPTIIIMIIGAGMLLSGSSEIEMEKAISVPSWIIGLIGMISSVLCVSWMFKRVNTIRDEPSFMPPPPPPAEFN